MENRCKEKDCNYSVENKKYKLCKIHNWERMNPGQNYFSEQSKKAQGYSDKMRQKQLDKPKKEVDFSKLTTSSNTGLPKPKKTQKPIRQFSKKREKLNSRYTPIRLEYMKENPMCEVDGCCNEATEIHHKKGKQGYADNWAKQNDIPLLIDKRWFMSICGGLFGHHRKVEDNPEWAKEMGYSLSRTENLDQ